MIFEIHHLTEFSYDKAVFVEPLTVRLRPRSDSRQNLLGFDMDIDPWPVGLTHNVDIDGTSSDRMWFDGLHDSLSIATRSKVDTGDHNPFDYVLDTEALQLPLLYAPHSEQLAPFVRATSVSQEVVELARSFAADAGMEPVPFIGSLTKHLHDELEYEVREQGDPLPSSTTLKRMSGSCRDLTVLLMDSMRTLGIAARFVSGYKPTNGPVIELHAWVEAYLPGAGWRGYDPTTGMAASGDHIALATAAHPRDAAPTSGSFRGTDSTSSLRTEIRVTKIDESSLGDSLFPSQIETKQP